MKAQALDLVLLNNLSDDEVLLVSLHEVGITTTDEKIRHKSQSLLRRFQSGEEWTYRQRELVKKLISGHRRSHFLRGIAKPKTKVLQLKPTPRLRFALYAVRIGKQLKIGHSSNVDSRVKQYRTGSSDVELLATLDLGWCSQQHARVQERKLQNQLGQYRIERELFKIEALPEFRAFVPRAEA